MEFVLAAGSIMLAIAPAWAQPGTPDIRGHYVGSGSVTLTNCANATFDLTATVSVHFDVSQTDQDFSAAVTASLAPIPASDQSMLTGTVTAGGQLSGTFTFTITVPSVLSASGNGTFTGQSTGNPMSLNITGKATSGETCNLTGHIAVSRDTTILAAAVLPGSRSVQVGSTATAFATIINGGATTGLSCGITIPALPVTFTFRTTDPATNAVTGPPNALVDIPTGGAQTYVISFTPNAELPPTDVAPSFACANAEAASVISGVNTLLLSASSTAPPDVVALAATLNNDGIVNIPGVGGTGVFAVASVNLGASGNIKVTADTGAASLPVTVALCQTNPVTGACLSVPASSVTTTIANGATPTFAFFVTATGSVAFDPAVNRVFVRFTDMSSNAVRGLTSVAARTTP